MDKTIYKRTIPKGFVHELSMEEFGLFMTLGLYDLNTFTISDLIPYFRNREKEIKEVLQRLEWYGYLQRMV